MAFIKFFVIRVRRLFEGGVYLKSNLFLTNKTVHCENSGEGALKYTHFELKNIVINEANFQSLIKLNYSILFSCFDYIPLSFECTDLKSLLRSREINFLGLLKLDYYCICFLSLLFE